MNNILPNAPKFSSAQTLDELHSMLELVKFKNGWSKPTPSLYPEPKKTFLPAHWSCIHAFSALHAAGKLISTDKAERRNLILANPIPGNDYPTVSTLVGAYQMVMPGEIAKSHRHSPNAMRIIIQGDQNTFTVVDGKSIPMLNGDVLLTPNGSYHGHINKSNIEAYWIDILDVPLVQYLGPMFFQTHPQYFEDNNEIDLNSEMRFSYSVFSQNVLKGTIVKTGVRKLELGPKKLVSFDRFVIHLEPNTVWENEKTTFNQIFVVIKGSGSTQVENFNFNWSIGDFLAIPSWYKFTHRSNEESILIRVTDYPLLKLLNFDTFNQN